MRRHARFQAVCELLQSDTLADEERQVVLRAVADGILEGVLTGDSVLLNRLMEGTMRDQW